MRVRKRILLYLPVVLALALCVVLALAVAMKSGAEAREATQDAQRYRSVPTLAPTTSPQSDLPVVSLVSDQLALAPAPKDGVPVVPWTQTVQRVLGVDLISLSSGGSGYTSRPSSSSFGGTFEARAQQVAPDSDVVVLFGGAADVRATRAQLLAAVKRAIVKARAAAPHAKVLVIGPTSSDDTPPSGLLAVRDAIRSAASVGDARFIDPIADGWLTDSKKLIADDGASLTPAGEQVVAHRMEVVLRNVLP